MYYTGIDLDTMMKKPFWSTLVPLNNRAELLLNPRPHGIGYMIYLRPMGLM